MYYENNDTINITNKMKSLNKFSHIGLFSFGVSQDGVRVMVFSAIFNKISVLLLEEILSLNVISCTPCHHSGLKLTTLVMIYRH